MIALKVVGKWFRKPGVAPLQQNEHLDADPDGGADEPEVSADRCRIP